MDPSLLWDMGHRNLGELRTPYGFAASDRTGLYSALFGRDSLWILILLIEAAKLHSSDAFLQWVREAGSDILSSLCDSQGTEVNDIIEEQPGKIIHEYREATARSRKPTSETGMPFLEGRTYSAFDQTFLFVIAYKSFADVFPGSPLVDRAWPNVRRALRWIEEYADDDGDGLFEYRRRHAGNLVNQVWKDSFDSITHTGFDFPPHPIAWIEVQAYAFRAFLEADRLHRARGDHEQADRFSAMADALKRKVNDQFWMEGERCFAMGLDATKKQVAMISSNASHALWAGIVASSRKEPLIRRLLQPDMMTPFGLRTLSSASPYYAPFAYHRGSIWPFDNAIFAAGLLQLGYEAEAQHVIEAVGSALLAIGSAIELYVVLDPELFVTPSLDTPALTYRRLIPLGDEEGRAVPLNRNQGWTAAALLFFAAALARIGGRRTLNG